MPAWPAPERGLRRERGQQRRRHQLVVVLVLDRGDCLEWARDRGRRRLVRLRLLRGRKDGDLLRRGLPLFVRNTITTNGTIPLEDFSHVTKNLLYVVSLDGPREINDSIRGKGVYDRVLANIGKLPKDFPHTVQCQCVVTRKNEASLETFVAGLRDSGFDHLTFSFYVPSSNDRTGNAWDTLEERDHAVRFVMELKERHSGFIRNRRRSLELLLSKNNPRRITDDCPAKRFVLPLYLEGKNLVSPFCCYGNDVDCDRCGAWVVFELAALEDRQGLSNSGR